MGHLDECKAIGTHWISLYVNRDNVTYFDNFGVEYIPKKIKTIIGKKNIATNIYGIHANNSILCGYFCIAFVDFMLKRKTLLDFTKLFSPNEHEENYKQHYNIFNKESFFYE